MNQSSHIHINALSVIHVHPKCVIFKGERQSMVGYGAQFALFQHINGGVKGQLFSTPRGICKNNFPLTCEFCIWSLKNKSWVRFDFGVLSLSYNKPVVGSGRFDFLFGVNWKSLKLSLLHNLLDYIVNELCLFALNREQHSTSECIILY